MEWLILGFNPGFLDNWRTLLPLCQIGREKEREIEKEWMREEEKRDISWSNIVSFQEEMYIFIHLVYHGKDMAQGQCLIRVDCLNSKVLIY